jgi:methionyl-tRNA formyltransferase
MATQSIRFAFFGTPRLAALFLDELEARGLVPSLVVTTPDKPQNRGLKLMSPPVKRWADARHIPVLQPDTLDADFLAQMSKNTWDVFVVIYYGNILPKKLLDTPKRGVLNVHFSLLPRFRGTSPVRAAILADEKRTGISILKMDEKIDHGPVVAQKAVAPAEWPPSASEFEELLTRESAELLSQILPLWLERKIEAREQNHDIATGCPAFKKEDGLIELSDDTYANFLKIRGFDSTIGTYAYFERGGKRIRVRILDAHVENDRLVFDRVVPEGKREMSGEEFLRSGAKPLTPPPSA